MNGFAINSSLIGPGRPVAGPWYVAAGDTGAETVSQVLAFNRPSADAFAVLVLPGEDLFKAFAIGRNLR